MEDELRDPKNALEYFLPRPLRIGAFSVSAAGCLIAAVLGGLSVLDGAGTQALKDLGVNLAGCAAFAALAVWDQRAGEQRVVERRELRTKQIKSGDREVYLDGEGRKMSRLKEVDDEWILRRLERWGRKDAMPFLGPKKGALVAGIVADRVRDVGGPLLAVEVGSMAGYSAILIGQQLPPGSKLISYEKDLFWFLAAKRFLWQASQGSNVRQLPQERIDRKVDVQLKDAVQGMQEWASSSSRSEQRKVQLLLLDGVPKETLQYLQAAEPLLDRGCIVVADNAGVFAQGGMAPYLEYVRSSPRYSSSYLQSTLEWRDDVVDGLEVSVFLG